MTPEVITAVAAMRDWSRGIHAEEGTIGFIPTMGFLHEGHLSLMRLAREKSSRSVVSIFVNPSQFGPGEDFERYPRNFDRDLALLKEARVDAVFHPSPDAIYPGGTRGLKTWVTVAPLSDQLCGAYGRRGADHFRGVATVVLKLLNIVEADDAWFGQKDAQQALIIRTMARDLNLGTRIHVAPTVRESDGLAMSSRNAYLTPDQRRAAPVLHRALQDAARVAVLSGNTASRILAAARLTLSSEPLLTTEYLELVDADSLEQIAADTTPRRALLAVAGKIGATRLIDNIIIETNA